MTITSILMMTSTQMGMTSVAAALLERATFFGEV